MTDAPNTDNPDDAEDDAVDAPNSTYNDAGLIDLKKHIYS